MAGVLRVCLAGDAAVGKTSLANSLVSGQFSEIPTTETIFSRSLSVDGKMTVVEFVDTSGSGDEYERSRVQLYPSSDLFLILFSVISPTSYESVRARVRASTAMSWACQFYLARHRAGSTFGLIAGNTEFLSKVLFNSCIFVFSMDFESLQPRFSFSHAQWAPEIKRYCPTKPLLLIGTKVCVLI